MAKTLKVCTSEELPVTSARDSNIIYFVYDKMQIYLGPSFFSDPFCIVDAMPEKPVESMLYILNTDGSVKSYYDYQVLDIATIESADEVALLKKAGTVYLQKTEYRYLDRQSKRLILPYQNGSYQLNVSLDHDISIDDDTLIRYNSTKKEFEIVGHESTDDTFGMNLNGYTGIDTNTINTSIINNNSILASLKVSSSPNNLIQALADGVFATVNNKANATDLSILDTRFTKGKAELEATMQSIKDTMDTASQYITDTYVKARIDDVLKAYYADLDNLINSYDAIYTQLGLIQSTSIEYFDTNLVNVKSEIINHIEEVSSAWENFTNNTLENASTAYSDFTSDELAIRAAALVEADRQILFARTVNGTHTADVDYYLTTDESGLDSSTALLPASKSIEITSEPSATLGFTHLTVSQKLTVDKYLYMVNPDTSTYLLHNQDLSGTTYKYWDGTSDLEIDNGATVLLAEVASDYKVVKYNTFTANSRISNRVSIMDLAIGTTTNNQCTVTTTNTLEDTHGYMYELNPTEYPTYGNIVGTDFSKWNSAGHKFTQGTAAYKVLIAECDSAGRAYKAGIIIIPATS